MFNLVRKNVKNKDNSLKLILNNRYKIKSYFYSTNFTVYEEDLCKMEMKYLFNKVPQKKYFFSHHYINPSRSPFIKQCIDIMYTANTLEDIIKQITSNNLSCENFKVSYINFDDESVGFHERRKIEYSVGLNIGGEAEMVDPKIFFGVTNVNGKWIFGEYTPNESPWQFHNRKPYSYSNALNVRTARAIVNIAVSNDLNCSIVDPCCGIGTVVMEALSLGLNIKGYEINPLIAENAKKNLEYFDYDPVITTEDMHTINNKFDVSIVDLPYGLFSPTTLEDQLAIIKTARRISKKSIIVTLENMDKHILSSGFNIVDKCYVAKGKFKRHITICE